MMEVFSVKKRNNKGPKRLVSIYTVTVREIGLKDDHSEAHVVADTITDAMEKAKQILENDGFNPNEFTVSSARLWSNEVYL